MNEQQAIALVQKTFKSAFDRSGYIHFLKNLLNEYDDEGARSNQGARIPEKFQNYVEKLERVGKYRVDRQEVMLFIVYLKNDTSIERARTMQRNFIAHYLQMDMKDAALVAFVSNDPADWRFSFIKMEYRYDEAKNKIREEFTPAKRWSFLVGTNEASHTAQRKLVPIMKDDEHNPTLADLEDAFNIEKVTKEFFEKYRGLFVRTKEALDEAVSANPKTRSDFASKGIDTVNLAKKLLGQIIFLYYLQKKGWFGVGRDAAWGEGSKNFLRELFDKKHGDYENFFNDILEPLFYDALRRDRSEDDHYYPKFNCKIPFLNGGLFDPMNNYDWVKTDILLPNELFHNKTRTKEGDEGDGILDVFDRYNFTVKEDEPFEKEVAIDPELLGKAYEKFNAIRPDNFQEFKKALNSGKKGDESKFNKQYGVYYTPREIVHYMCQQSLINYLFSEVEGLRLQVEGDGEGDNSIGEYSNAESSNIVYPTKDDFATLILKGEQIKEHDERVAAEGRETATYSFQMPESIRTHAALIDEKLANIKVCDPAVGSGAFPVGMMSEIVRARDVLRSWTKTKKTLYDFKRGCIENSLYGVDIDPGAVEIAKLRLWLSLVVDEDDIHNIKPLPNLDYKIVQGNSLVGLPEGILLDLDIKAKLEEQKKRYFYLTNSTEKNKARDEINALFFRLVESAKQFDPTLGNISFDFHTHFSEVFHEESGFDIVIGNPPYIDSETMVLKDAEERNIIAKIFQTTKGNWDLYIPFWEKSLKLMSQNGTATLITPNKWLSISYGKALREFSKKYIYHLVDYSKFRAFDEAGVFAVVAFMSKQKQERIRVTSFIDKNELAFDLLVPVSTFNEFESNWGAFLSQHLPLVFRLIENKSKLENLCDVEEPFTVSEAYLLSDIIAEKEKIKEKYLKFINTGTIDSYATLWGTKPTTYLKKKYTHPSIAESQMKKNFPRRFVQSKDTKIIISGIRHFECFLDNNGEWVAGKSTVILRNFQSEISPKFLLGILNSHLTKFFLKECYGSLSMDGGINFSPSNVSQIPIVQTKKQKPMELLVERILAAKAQNPQADTSPLEGEVDQLVYQLYGLTQEEIGIVEGK